MRLVTDEVLEFLARPFDPDDIEWRVQTAGEKNGRPWARVLAYVTNRAIMDRLDEVVGPSNWHNEFQAGPDGGVICGISIHVGEEWVTKWDGAENSDVEPVKGGLSNAMKRAAVQWGIGRYLYGLEEGWANVHDDGQFSAKTKDGKWFKWDPPELPDWALPQPDPEQVAHEERLDAIKKAFEKIPKEATLTVDGDQVPLKPFIKKNGVLLKESPALSRTVAAAVEEAVKAA